MTTMRTLTQDHNGLTKEMGVGLGLDWVKGGLGKRMGWYLVMVKVLRELAGKVERAISGHMLGAARVQIPENNLDDLQSSREEDETSETMDPQDWLGSFLLADIDLRTLDLLIGTLVLDFLGCDPLALVDGFTPVEDNIGLLETKFVEEEVFVFVFPKDVMGSVNLTLLSLFFGITATNFSSVLLTLRQVLLMYVSNS
ncbi:hypothetical protein Tco_0497168 [Tanacetum coccineum]